MCVRIQDVLSTKHHNKKYIGHCSLTKTAIWVRLKKGSENYAKALNEKNDVNVIPSHRSGYPSKALKGKRFHWHKAPVTC